MLTCFPADQWELWGSQCLCSQAVHIHVLRRSGSVERPEGTGCDFSGWILSQFCFLQSYPQLQPGEAAGRDIWISCQSSSAFGPKSSSILIITSSYTPPRRKLEAWGGEAWAAAGAHASLLLSMYVRHMQERNTMLDQHQHWSGPAPNL